MASIVISSQRLSLVGVRPEIKFNGLVLLCSVDCPSATTNFINVILKLLKLIGCLLVMLKNEVH